MVSAVATHASTAPSASSPGSNSAAAEPGFQAALNSSQQATKSDENAAPTSTARTDAAKKVPDEPERGRSERKRDVAGARSFEGGGTAPGTPGSPSPAGLADLAGELALPLPVQLLLPSASGLPLSTSKTSAADPQASDSQAIATMSQDGDLPANGAAPALTAQSAGLVALPGMNRSAPGAWKGEALSTSPGAKTAATQSAKELGSQVTFPHGQSFSDQPPARFPATPPIPDTGQRAPGNGLIAPPAMGTALAPASASYGVHPGLANAGTSTAQASVPIDAQGNSAGKEGPQSGSESAGTATRPAGNKNLDLAASSAIPFSIEGASAAPVPVHAAAAIVESVNPALSVSVAPPSTQLIPATSNSAAGGGTGTLPPGETNAGTESQPINAARVLQSMSGTEMRVGMHSQEFGSISIATLVTPGGVAAQIALDHGALSRALATHLPSIEDKLGSALGVSARVELRDGGGQSSQASDSHASEGGAYGGGGSQRGTPGREAAGSAPQRSGDTAYAMAAPEAVVFKAADKGRLSVQA